MNTMQRNSSAGSEVLGLGRVVVGSLPAKLMSTGAPTKYTVEAVFTRRPDRDEATAIVDAETRTVLADAGYPDVTVTISDRRLEIANTSLEELRNGLATVLADRLADITWQVRVRLDATAAKFQLAADEEQKRADAVRELAESIAFVRSAQAEVAAAEPRLVSDGSQVDTWADEGGR